MNIDSNLTICFAHPAYQMEAQFKKREAPYQCFQAWSPDEVQDRIHEFDVMVCSGYWQDQWLEQAPRLKFVQSISAGINQYGIEKFQKAGIWLASAAGVNANAVSEHAMAHILSFSRLMHTGRDYQRQKHYRGMISTIDQREDELGGKTILIVGLGRIGKRLARLAKAFDMHVIGTKRQSDVQIEHVDQVYSPDRFKKIAPLADFVALTCPLTAETEGLVDSEVLELMKPSSYLINMARGAVVDEPALILALQNGEIAGAGLDVFAEEPLPQASPLWEMDNVIITPHSAGETQRYEDSVIDILLENLARLERGESQLLNQVV
ncbi:MAG: D-2-hydroxyacid dehydrogenase [Anaerolineae bacterium]